MVRDPSASLPMISKESANVGRFLEVGLPDHAREAAVQTRKSSWAGSYLFDAATARSGVGEILSM